LLQQRGKFSLDLDDPSLPVELARQTVDLPLQAGDLTIAGIGLLAARRAPECLMGTAVVAAGARC
jgi:hypothetical protein